jgi:prepilin-type N-terminal cleavage/methylation domain-containing protein
MKQAQKGFTLVELLIVVIILAILAAIVVPQFASTTDDAKLSSLDTTLSNMRAAIDLYYQQHGVYPGAAISTGGTCDTGTADLTGTAVNTQATVLAQLSLYTNAAGLACTGTGTNYKYGPYLKKGELPKNPITELNVTAVAGTGTLGMVSTITNKTGGWKYDTKTGQFIADDHRLVGGAGTQYYDAR